MSETTPTAPPAMTPDPNEGAIVRREGLAMGFAANAGAGVRLHNFAELLAFGRSMVDSGFVPKGFVKPAQVVWAVQRGAELGIGPTASLDAFYVSPAGAPELYAEAALGICVASGLLLDTYEKWVDGEGDKLTGHFRFQRRGWPAARETTFTVADAKRAKLIKPGGGWETWPQRMVLARVVSFALHDYFADVLLGCAIAGDRIQEHAVTVQGTATVMPARETAPPADPDPLLAAVLPARPLTATVVPAGDVEVVEDPPPGCSHPSVPPSRVAQLAPGKSIVCNDCGEDLRNDAAETETARRRPVPDGKL